MEVEGGVGVVEAGGGCDGCGKCLLNYLSKKVLPQKEMFVVHLSCD